MLGNGPELLSGLNQVETKPVCLQESLIALKVN
jgi:hypothetical protein